MWIFSQLLKKLGLLQPSICHLLLPYLLPWCLLGTSLSLVTFFHRKKHILARLNGVQCALTFNPSESLFRLEKSLREDYFIVLKLEEELWALKSRVGWVVEGDRSTKFFHASTIVCRRANKIIRLRNSVREWITDSELIRLYIQQGFVDLFSTSHHHPPSGFCLPMWAPRVLEQEALSLTAHVDVKDVKMSLWSLKAFKAPEPDGLYLGFFQKCWPIVGDSVVNEVRQIFSSGRMPEYLNRTLISLIPKCLGPETLSQFCPISLCNTVYKIVTKIIVCRLRPIVGNLVSLFQAVFVPGRRGLDNVVIAQELIHSIHRKKGRLGQLILKLDLEKVYDRLEWNFIHEVLSFFKFPLSFVDLVLKCVTTSSFSILVNGGQLENFKPSRGIRQGDPLSPYLFILCMEYLSLKILEACDNNSWKAIKVSRRGPHIYSLLMISCFVLRLLVIVALQLLEFLTIFVFNLVKRLICLSPRCSFPLMSTLFLGITCVTSLGFLAPQILASIWDFLLVPMVGILETFILLWRKSKPSSLAGKLSFSLL